MPSTLIKTPLGDLEFLVGIENRQPAEVSIKAAPIRPTIPPGMSVLTCYGVVLQVNPSTSIEGLSFTARFQRSPSICHGPATGEGLEAQEWANGEYVLLIGTEDFEYLRARLPGSFLLSDSLVTYTKDSLSILIDKIPPGQPLTLHFVIAWNKVPESAEQSCWFAVDQSHLAVLNSVFA